MQFLLAGHDTAGRKVWPFDIFHHLCGVHIRMFHIGNNPVDHLAKIVGRNTGDHAYGNAFCAVNQYIWHFHRQHQRFFFRLVKIRDKVHHIFIQIRQICLLRNFFQPCFRITHGGGAVSFNGAKISMAVHQRQALLKVLGQNHQRFINRAVAVGMIFTHRIAHNTGALAVRPVITDPQLVHVIQRPALHRF